MINVLCTTPRSVTVDINDGGKYNTLSPYTMSVAGREIKDDRCVISVFGLEPDTDYTAKVTFDDAQAESLEVSFTTRHESMTLNVRDYGAYGDGVHDDTAFIHAAIMCCPKDGRVLIPEGTYLHKGIFLSSDIYVELAKGARLVMDNHREEIPRFPARLEGSNGHDEYFLGTWEGEAQPMFCGTVNGISINNTCVYGEGIIDGGASKEDWWLNPKVMRIAYRPKLIFLKGCSNVIFQGVTVQNSPSWTIHPFFSNDLGFYSLTIINPKDSPNTDGFDPESCNGIEMAGIHFSVGDDCIAVKSGKIDMGRLYKTPSQNIHIYSCLMEDGHGAVTVGSEAAAGVKKLVVERCKFVRTDRGLRIKTRRGRGEDSVLDDIIFRDIDMDGVITPFVVNAFYYCDSDGKTDYVQNRDALPVDERTPYVKRLIFERIDIVNAHFAAAWIEGLPERPIEEIVMHDINVRFAEDAKSGMPAMANNVPECCREGFILKNVDKTDMVNVNILN